MSHPPSPSRESSADPAAPLEDLDRTVAGDLFEKDRSDTEPTPTMPQAAVESPAAAEWPSVPGYHLLALLGRGGMGVVYKARQIGLGRYVALKMILGGGHAAPEDMVRFLAEGEAVAQLQHTNVVQIYQVGRHGDLPFFSLEYVDGGSLAQRLDGKPQPPRDAARLIECLARAMSLAHQKGIVHRDLKPSNILLASGGRPQDDADAETGSGCPSLADCVPKITDFGLAKRVEAGPGLTQTGAILGTPSYMAPEQAEARKDVGPATDVYALGAILYEMLTGRPPFHAPTQLETVLQVLNNEPVPPMRLQPGCPRDLDTICLKCLHKDAARRYASAEALAEDLQRFLTDRPILARRVGSLERLRRWCRRNPAIAAMTTVVALLLVLLAAGSLLAAVWLNAARESALEHLGRAGAAERRRTEQLATSYLEQARARRFSRQVGQRFLSLEALTKAVRIIRGMDLDDEARDRRLGELRDEAIACLTLPDLRPARRLDDVFIQNHGTGFQQAVVFTSGWDVYARAEAGGPISLRRLEDDSEILRLPGTGPTAYVLAFSPDGRYLAAKYYQLEKPIEYRVWDWRDSRVVVRQACAPNISPTIDFAFTPDSRHVLLGCRADALLVRYELATSEEKARLNPGVPAPWVIALHPDGRRLATVDKNEVTIRDADTGMRLGAPWQLPGGVWALAWQGEGSLLAAASDDRRIYLWDAATRQERGVLEGHEGTVVKLAFNADGTLLASSSWDHTTRLWDPVGGKELLRVPSDFLQFSPDGRQLAYVKGKELGIWELAERTVCRLLAHPGWLNGVDFHNGGELLAVATNDDTHLWDVRSGKQLASLHLGSTASAFFRSSSELVTLSQRGLLRWPLRSEELGRFHVEKPRRLAMPPGAATERFCLDARGEKLVFVTGERLAVMDLGEKSPTRLLGHHPRARYLDVSPDGRWVATSTFKGVDVKVWDLTAEDNQKATATLPGGDRAFVRFSRDGRWLMVDEDVRMVRYVYRVGSWELARQEPITPGDHRLDVTQDGRMMAASAEGGSAIRLCDPVSGHNWAMLPSLQGQHVSVWAFNRDGGQLAVGNDRFLQLWDLQALRARLAEMDLDWRTNPHPPDSAAPVKQPLTVTVEGVPGVNALPAAVVVLPRNKRRHTATAAQIAGWIRQLDAADAVVRQTAADALAAAGMPAVKPLSAIDAGPDGAKGKQVRAILDRITVAEALTPTRVRLQFNDATLADALRAFAEQTGIKLTQPPALGLKSRRITLRLDDVPAWEALDRLCSAAGVHLDTFNFNSLGVSERSPPVPIAHGYCGPFRVHTNGAYYHRQVGAFGVNEGLQLSLQLFKESRFRGLSVSSLRATEATSDDGQSLVLDKAVGFLQGGFPTGDVDKINWGLSLKGIDRRGGKIKLLKGILTVEVMVRPHSRLIVPDLAKAQGRTFFGEDGRRVTIQRAQRSGNQWSLFASLSGPPGWRYEARRCGLELRDARGRSMLLRHSLTGPGVLRGVQPEDVAWLAASPLASSLSVVPWTAIAAQSRRPTTGPWQGNLWTSNEPLEGPVSLRWFDCEYLRTELPFELRDVPLP